ncbi:hypothetical protein ZWY2020_036984 [Hordeum vulgare]|nr:hypothetical protein ZWY2020_036984 [Hordeum vulgare]
MPQDPPFAGPTTWHQSDPGGARHPLSPFALPPPSSFFPRIPNPTLLSPSLPPLDLLLPPRPAAPPRPREPPPLARGPLRLPLLRSEGSRKERGGKARAFDARQPMATPAVDKPDGVEIREVWAENLEAEFAVIRDIVDDYPYVAMDTEFPGVVCRPLGTFKSNADFNYATLKANVDMLKLIQLGLTFSDERGGLPALGPDGRPCVWQFNFRGFDPRTDVAAADSIDLLRRSGIDFARHAAEGADSRRFAELLMSSGVVLNAEIHWVTFHSGYDFGYLLKLLTGSNLPDTSSGFFDLIRIYFPVIYDIKHLMRFCNSLHGGLNKLAELLDVERVGICHQAGSDSLLTALSFNKLKESYFGGLTEKYAGVLYGLGTEGGETTSVH